jgi:TP901-1 family phage major tail protein
MTAQKGRGMLLKLDTAAPGAAAPVFTSVAGLQSKHIGFNQELVDITNQDSPEGWRELLFDAGTRKVSISGSGVFTDGAAGKLMFDNWLSREPRLWQVIVPGLGTFMGLFLIVKMDFKGPHDKEISFDMSMENAGPITFIAP